MWKGTFKERKAAEKFSDARVADDALDIVRTKVVLNHMPLH